jgi:pyridoxal phosphate enzyme (YggS family)
MGEGKENIAVDVAANLAEVRRRMAAAAQRAGRNPDEILLTAVSKMQPFAAIEAAYAAGQRDFGENRVEELWPKVEAAQAAHLHEIRWHLIGPIQSRKTALAVGPFVLVHAVDRQKIAVKLSQEAQNAGQVMAVLLEVNISGEESKHGFTPEEARQTLPELARLPGIEVQGLMTMAPYVENPETVRPVFRELRRLRDELAANAPKLALPQLSMGMTNDYEVAIEEGATIVRIGSAIFGARPT